MKSFTTLTTSLLLALGGCASVAPPSLQKIVAMSQAGEPAAKIIATLDASDAVYPLSASELATLSRQGVADAVLDHLLDTRIEVERSRAYWLARDFGPITPAGSNLVMFPRLPPLLPHEAPPTEPIAKADTVTAPLAAATEETAPAVAQAGNDTTHTDSPPAPTTLAVATEPVQTAAAGQTAIAPDTHGDAEALRDTDAAQETGAVTQAPAP